MTLVVLNHTLKYTENVYDHLLLLYERSKQVMTMEHTMITVEAVLWSHDSKANHFDNLKSSTF